MTAANPKKEEGDLPQGELSGETQSSTDQTPTTENGQNDTEEDEAKAAKKRKKLQRLVRILLVLPYIIGLLWTSLHPIVSVITGELKCRGWYLDEHSIETRFTIGQKPQTVPAHLQDIQSTPLRSKSNDYSFPPYSLCDFFAAQGDPGFNAKNLICHQHGDHFEMAMIMPLSNAIDASEEAVVLVVPRPSDVYPSSRGKKDWNSSVFHQAMIKSIKHLANPVETPWLAKAVLVVTPTMNSNHQSLDQTVAAFLDAYSGHQAIPPRGYRRNQQEYSENRIPQLPPKLSGAILRNLVVLEVRDKSTTRRTSKQMAASSSDISILPQGRRGVLPNADMVFLVGKLMEKTLFHTHAQAKTFLAHPYTQESKAAEVWANGWIDDASSLLESNEHHKRFVRRWAKGMIDVALFCKTLAVGPYPPHAPALERGIDSLTIQTSFEGTFHRDPSVELVQYSEYIVRSLANLHERLHHSFTLYLLPTPKSFVSHIEYLLPNILVLLPMAVRVFGMLLPSMKRGLDLTAVGAILGIVLVLDVALLLEAELLDSRDSPQSTAALLLLLYAGAAFFWVEKILYRNHHRPPSRDSDKDGKDDHLQDSNPETTRTILTLQYVTCALAVYILVPIAFSNASISYLPSVLWTPLLAFPNYPSMKRSNLTTTSTRGGAVFQKFGLVPILCLLVVVTAPPVLLVPRMFSGYTPFVRYAYAPIHLLFLLLVTSILVS